MAGPNGYLSRYLARHWCAVPIHRPNTDDGSCSCGKANCAKPGKHPDGRFWPNGSSDVAHFADRNIGVKLGPESQNLADVDLDCGEAVACGPALLPATDSAFGRGGHVTHALYVVPARDAAFLKLQDPVLDSDRATIVELRWPEWDEAEQRYKALQTVFPPSLHHTGGTVEWVHDGAPAEVAGTDLVGAVKSVGAAVLLARYAKPKERHKLVLLVANLLVRAGWSDDKKAVQFLAAVFEARNDADKAAKVRDGEGLGAVRDARKRAASGKPMTGLPALKDMLDPALDTVLADQVVACVKEWLGVPDAPAEPGATKRGPVPNWEPPVPLPEPDDVSPFPIDLFPPAVADYWAAAASALHVPIDYVACPGLVVLGAAIGRSRTAEVKPGYDESALFWIAVVAPPGSAKSVSLRHARGPLDDAEARWRADHAAALVGFEGDQARYENALKEWKKAPEGEPPAKPRRPALRQSVLDDTTTEAARRVLRDNPRGAAVLMDELTGFTRQLNQYRDGGRGADKTFWLSGWNGRGLSKNNRAGTHDAGPLVVVDPFTAVGGMLCPDSIGELREELRRGGAANDGWADRFLLSFPPPLPAVEETWATVPEGLSRGYAEAVQGLLGLEMVPVEDPAREGACRPYVARFDERARAAWQAFTRDVAARANRLPAADAYRGVLSKLKHYGVRFACLFHCVDAVCNGRPTEGPVGPESVRKAVAVVWYFEAQGRRCLGVGAPETQAARLLLPAVAGWKGEVLSKRELHRKVRGQSAFRRAGNLDAPLKELAAHGYVRSTDGEPAGGGRPSERFAINPLWDRAQNGTPPNDMDNMDKTPETTEFSGVRPDMPGAGQKGFVHGQNPNTGVAGVAPDSAPAEVLAMDKTLLAGAGHGGMNCGNLSTSEGFVHIVHAVPGGVRNETGYGPVGKGKPVVVTDAAGVARLAGEVRSAAGPVAVDTETTGLDPARDRVRLMQLAAGEAVSLVDLFAFPDPGAALAPLFAALAGKELVGHNIVSFDLPFLARLGFAPARVFDTALASRVVYAGERVDHDLASVVQRELKQTLDKGQQNSEWSRPELSPQQLAYAAADVAVLLPLADALRARAAERKVEAVVELEMRCGVPVARMAATGVGFETAAWEALADTAATRRVTVAAEMDALIPNPGCLPGLEAWNWDSNAGDVPKAFAAAGVTLPDTKEETLAGIEHPLACLLLEYREAAKRAGTYGREWVREHVTGGRVYATWNPCQAKTGRMSCKGPNLQQVPRAAEYRRCFVARPGHALVKCDYSQIELRIAATVTGDARMLAAYRAGEDLHTLTAARFLGVGVDAVTKEARQTAKPVNFGAIYGLGPRSLRLKARADYGREMTEGQARGFLDAFFAQYPGVRAWHDRLKRERATAVRTLGGRRVAVEADQFYGAKANYVIQGTGGDGLKRALVLLWERRGECPGAEVVLAVHDEIVVEVPDDRAEAAKGWVERGMIDAMAPLIDPVPVEVEAKVGTTWGG